MARIEPTIINGHGAGSVERFFQFSLLGLVASGYFAVAGSGYLDLVTIAVTGAAILVRATLLASESVLPVSDRWVTAVTIIYIGFYPLDYLFVSGEFLPATVHLVLFLAVVKILTARNERDYLYVVVVAFLELLAASLLSSRLNYFVFLAFFLIFAVSTFASWEIRRSARKHAKVAQGTNRALSWRLASLATVVTIGVLLITAGLFFVLPRTARAAFERLVPDRYHLTAFSNEVTLGEIGEIQQTSTVLMHVRIPGTRGRTDLKWRGNALAEFDGMRWFNSDLGGERLPVTNSLLRLADDDQRRRSGRRLSYEVQLKAFASDTLFVAGEPEFLRINTPVVIRTPEDGYRVGFRDSGVLRYGVFSYLEGSGPRTKSAPVLETARRMLLLRVPRLDPRIGELAREITSPWDSPIDKARALEQYLRTRYAYTLELPDTTSDDPIARFLFERRKGHCEYFASSMALMLRLIGIPSRVATGFQSGIYNPISGWQVIRASDAHSWVEAYLPEIGWMTFDPTPAGEDTRGGGLLSRVSFFFDAADTFWQEWVLEYDLNRQLTLATRMGKSGRRFSFGWLGDASASWRELKSAASQWLKAHGYSLLGVLALLGALGFAIPRAGAWWTKRARARRVEQGGAVASDATVMYQRALKLLKKKGLEKPAAVTPREFTRLIPSLAVAGAVGRLTDAYHDLRFGGRREAALRMLNSLSELERVLKVDS